MALDDHHDPVMPLADRHRAGSAPKHAGSKRLRMATVMLDATSVGVAWLAALLLMGSDVGVFESALVILTAVVTHWIAFERAGLYLSRVSAIRLEEMTRALRSVAAVSVSLFLVARMSTLWAPGSVVAVAGAFTLCLLFAQRSALRAWLLRQRAAGRFCRTVVLIGTNDEAVAMYDIISQHPELGYIVVGVYGDEGEAARRGLGALYRGDEHAASWHVHDEGTTGAIVAASSLDAGSLNRITRELLAVGAHVQLSSRLAGFASRRLQAQSIAYEPIIYLQRLQLARWQTFVKRSIDIVLGLLILAPASLVIAAFAAAVKLEDRGPAFFKQTRIGKDGKPFQVLKLRTMVTDAEDRLARLQAESNERGGPLFKMESDPRFTRIGRFMDLTSINKLPQLWNVVRGEMNIVGPRPALPDEHAAFDGALQTRTVVRPGITGLWQVEARDNPSFDAYRRFDLHYVENWSVSLDLMILVATAESVLARLVRMARANPAPALADSARNPARIERVEPGARTHTGHEERRAGVDRRASPRPRLHSGDASGTLSD